MSEFKFLCSQCGQHLLADEQSAGAHFPCPHCQAEQRVPGLPFTSPPGNVTGAANDAPWSLRQMCSRWREAGAKWIDVVFLVLIGVLSPWLLMFATAFTMILGSLAYVAAPVVSGFGSYLIASFCLERTSRRLFWIYPCMALMSFAFPFMGELFPKQGPGGGGEPSLGGAMAATSGALAMFLVVPFVLFPWAVGLAVAALRHSKPPN